MASVSKSWADAKAITELDGPQLKAIDMDEMQLMELAEAHIAMKTELCFDLAAEFKNKLDDIRHTKWFRLLVMQTLVKRYDLKYMGI